MKKRIVFELAAGILILVSALYTYVPKSQYMYELTFISNRKNELAERYGYRDYHVYIGRYLGAFNLLGWKVGEKYYRLKITVSNLKIWRYTHDNY